MVQAVIHSQAAMKLYNRQNELLGDAAERAATVAALYAGHPYPTESFTEAWKRFIFHQFHDDLTGTSIPRAYEFSWNDELLSLKQFSDLMTDAVSSVASTLNTKVGGIPVLMFNPLGYETTDVVELQIPAKNRPSGCGCERSQWQAGEGSGDRLCRWQGNSTCRGNSTCYRLCCL